MLRKNLTGSPLGRLAICLLFSAALHALIFSLEGGHRSGGDGLKPSGPLIVSSFRPAALPESQSSLPSPTATSPQPAPSEPLPTTKAAGKNSRETAVSAANAKSSPLPVKYYTRSELNRYPVLLTPLPTDIDQDLELDLTHPGESIFRVFINEAGEVVMVEPEESKLPAALTQRARQVLMKARFMPGYWSGNPVPSMLRWRFDVVPSSRANLHIREVDSR